MKLLPDCQLRVETDRFGPLTFQVGADLEDLTVLLQRVEDAHELFIKTPLNQVASQLEIEVVVSSVFGTNTIEGGTLSEAETARVLQLDPAEVKETEQRRAVNIKAAYDHAQEAARTPGWRLDLDFIRSIHAHITRDLPDPDMVPGVFRDNPKGKTTYVGDEAHGGRYKPPQYGGDVQLLMGKLIEWHDCLLEHEVPALIRAPLVHLYYETIHPFWDGNGRVGRVIEATLLQAAGYRYAPFAMARHYLDNIDEYFTLFNTCRKNAEKHGASPNQSSSTDCTSAATASSGCCSTRATSSGRSTARKSTRASTPSFRSCSTKAPPASKRCGTAPGIEACTSSSTTRPGCAT